MMTEYIKREEVKKLININFSGLLAAIDTIPAADVAPVVHGRWVPFHSEIAGDIQYCSACEIGFSAKTNYCPRCGAKMDGGNS